MSDTTRRTRKVYTSTAPPFRRGYSPAREPEPQDRQERAKDDTDGRQG